MTIDLTATESCAVCGAGAGEGRAFWHFYPEGRAVALCSSVCAESFLRGPVDPMNAEHNGDYLEELAQEKGWAAWRT